LSVCVSLFGEVNTSARVRRALCVVIANGFDRKEVDLLLLLLEKFIEIWCEDCGENESVFLITKIRN